MLPMSNNGINNATTNGRNSANSTTTTATAKTSISHKQNDGKTMMTTMTASSMPPPLPEKNYSTIQKSNNNDSNSSSSSSSNTNAATQHRRDSSSISGQQQHQNKRDSRKYQYAKPQTQLQQQSKDKNVEEQQNVADDAEDDSQLLVYYEGNLVSGTLDALIEHMVPTSEYYPERNYIFSFLLSARLFIRPHELLAQISQTWERQHQKFTIDVVDEANFSHLSVAASASPLLQRKVIIVGGVTVTTAIENDTVASHAAADTASLMHGKSQRSATQKCAQNCIRLLSEWIETFPYDFRDERLMQQVRILARKCVYIDNSLGKQVSRILQLLVQRLTALEKYEEFLQSLIAADLNSSQHSSLNTSASASYTASSSSSFSNATMSVAGLNNCLGKSNHHHTESHHKSTLPASLAIHASSASNSNASAVAADSSNSHDLLHGIMDICSSCAHLAHQLTAIELDRLSHIGPEEFVQAFAKEYQHSIASKVIASSASSSASTSGGVMSTSLNDMKKTRNLESYVEWFNRLSYLTASEIVKYPKKKQRVRIIEYWIETARECFNIGNFNSLMAIIAGLNLSPISRLKKTWSKVQSAKFSVLEHQMDPTSNFNSYRSTLKAAMWRSEGATDERERIIIPFFSLFVKDLYFLNEGCSNRLPNNHINFEKCSQLAKQVMEFNEWKKVICPFEKLPNVIAFLQNSTVLNENTLSMASFECEPPENTEEKGRYKTVKAETKQQLLQQLQ